MILGYITAKDAAEAALIGRTLVEKRLAACANILPSIESIYPWEGKIETAQEALLLIKTSAELKQSVISCVKALHSYRVPCVVFWDLNGGNSDYLDWAQGNLNSAKTGA